MTSIRENVRKVLARPNAHQLSDREVAERALEMGDEYDWRDCALELLPDAVWSMRRSMARKAEKEARAYIEQQKRERERQAQEAGFPSWDEWQEHVAHEEEQARRLDVANRAGFESWDEMQRATIVRRATEDEEALGRAIQKLQGDLERHLEPYVAAMEFTEAFLNSEFAVGDGRRVTWGDATSDDHIARIKLMQAQIAGINEDIELHQRVVEVLSTFDAPTLREARTMATNSAPQLANRAAAR